MDATDVLLRLLTVDLSLPSSTRVELIVHESRLNWRQRHATIRERVRNLPQGLLQDGPFCGQLVGLGNFEEAFELIVDQVDGLDVVSVSSRLFDHGGNFIGHLAIMNLHPDGLDGVDAVVAAVAATTEHIPGYLLSSGRYYHYYGKRLLTGGEWQRFLARFLMPCVLVSPRYIGHSLFRGFCTVRLTSARPYKPTVPRVVSVM